MSRGRLRLLRVPLRLNVRTAQGTYVRSHFTPTLGGATTFSFPMDSGTEGNDASLHSHWLDELSRRPASPSGIGVDAGAGVGAPVDITIREFCASVMERASALEVERAMDIAVSGLGQLHAVG